MLLLIERWIPRLARMNGVLADNETGLPLLTCDNPAIAWKKSRDGSICGVDQHDPELIVSCPLTATLMFVAYQTPESLAAIQAGQHDIPRADRKPRKFTSHVAIGSLPAVDVERTNQICVGNAHRKPHWLTARGRSTWLRKNGTDSLFAPCKHLIQLGVS